MTRSLRPVLPAVGAAVALVGLVGTGCQTTGVGDPCTPEAEYDVTFLGFDYHEVSTESADFQCFSRLCLVNHFQGRASCPYGQGKTGQPPSADSQACSTPFIHTPITGNPDDPTVGATVLPQCTDRTSDLAVYCSCRCANVEGQTDDGEIYCKCPSGFACTQLVSSIGGNGNQGLTGAYCIKDGTEYNPDNVCNQECSAALANCGNAQGVMAQ